MTHHNLDAQFLLGWAAAIVAEHTVVLTHITDPTEGNDLD